MHGLPSSVNKLRIIPEGGRGGTARPQGFKFCSWMVMEKASAKHCASVGESRRTGFCECVLAPSTPAISVDALTGQDAYHQLWSPLDICSGYLCDLCGCLWH